MNILHESKKAMLKVELGIESFIEEDSFLSVFYENKKLLSHIEKLEKQLAKETIRRKPAQVILYGSELEEMYDDCPGLGYFERKSELIFDVDIELSELKKLTFLEICPEYIDERKITIKKVIVFDNAGLCCAIGNFISEYREVEWLDKEMPFSSEFVALEEIKKIEASMWHDRQADNFSTLEKKSAEIDMLYFKIQAATFPG